MTFGVRTFQGMSQGAVSPPSFSGGNVSLSAGIRSVSCGLVNDGTSTGSMGTGNWFTPTQSGIGSQYWVKLTVTSTTNTTITGSATATVLSVGGVGWTFTNTGSTVEGFGTFTLTFYSDAAGTQVVGTSTGNNWDVGQAH